ncbi:MAG: phosphoribosyl-AMP cyclohydrolase [Anaerolineales bacterium]
MTNTQTMKPLQFDEHGLIPAVIQDADSLQVLMVGWMNEEALEATQETGQVHFWSRSRRKLWRKGETSGNTLELQEIWQDCDQDTLLVKANPSGPTCHTGHTSCFFTLLEGADA